MVSAQRLDRYWWGDLQSYSAQDARAIAIESMPLTLVIDFWPLALVIDLPSTLVITFMPLTLVIVNLTPLQNVPRGSAHDHKSRGRNERCLQIRPPSCTPGNLNAPHLHTMQPSTSHALHPSLPRITFEYDRHSESRTKTKISHNALTSISSSSSRACRSGSLPAALLCIEAISTVSHARRRYPHVTIY